MPPEFVDVGENVLGAYGSVPGRDWQARENHRLRPDPSHFVDRLDSQAIGAWRKRLPERSAWAIHKALRQVLHYAVRIKLLDENPATLIPNPEPKRREVPAFESVAEIETVAEELHSRFSPSPSSPGSPA